ncbi:MAG TPA: hypothetical protein VFY14_08715 [Streptomyces sp.]|nr:hypothetical protein [Streptomyces sp.]
MQLTQPAVSLQAVQVMISAIQDGAAYSPVSDPVSMAFVVNPTFGAAAAPAASSGSWNAATWETDSAGGTSQYWCSCLVGPGGGVTLTAGTAYTVFVKIANAASGETPILPACGLMIT